MKSIAYRMGQSDFWYGQDTREEYCGEDLEQYLAGREAAYREWLENGF